MTDNHETAMPKLKPCPCGGAGYSPQLKHVRVPGTFTAICSIYFCMGGCNRDGVGMTEKQAIDNWNNSIQSSIALEKLEETENAK